MRQVSKYPPARKTEIIRKYLGRTESRTEFSRRHNIPVTTIDTWVKMYRRKQRESENRPKTFVPLIPRESSKGFAGSLNIDFPGGIRMSLSGDYKPSDIVTIASELGKVKL